MIDTGFELLLMSHSSARFFTSADPTTPKSHHHHHTHTHTHTHTHRLLGVELAAFSLIQVNIMLLW